MQVDLICSHVILTTCCPGTLDSFRLSPAYEPLFFDSTGQAGIVFVLVYDRNKDWIELGLVP